MEEQGGREEINFDEMIFNFFFGSVALDEINNPLFPPS